MSLLALLLATGCAGRWLAVPEPSRMQPSKPGPRRDYRVVLRSDSVAMLLDAVVRDDSIVELPSGEPGLERAGPPRGVALADVAHVELWQPAGERVAGGVAVTLLAVLAAIAYSIARAVGS